MGFLLAGCAESSIFNLLYTVVDHQALVLLALFLLMLILLELVLAVLVPPQRILLVRILLELELVLVLMRPGVTPRPSRATPAFRRADTVGHERRCLRRAFENCCFPSILAMFRDGAGISQSSGFG